MTADEGVGLWPGLRPGPDLGDGPYSFLYTHLNGSPVRWGAVEPVRLVINPTAARPEATAVELTLRAVRQVAEATGINFVYIGTTRAVPRRDRPVVDGGQWAPLLVAWTSGSDGDPARGAGNSCGYGGPELVATSEFPVPVYVTGQVAVDTSVSVNKPGWSEQDWMHVLLHELGHVMGLGHVRDARQVMSPQGVAGSMSSGYGTGDLAGLRLLGTTQGVVATPAAALFDEGARGAQAPAGRRRWGMRAHRTRS